MMKVFCFGLGYSATAFAQRCKARGWPVAGTTRTQDKARLLAANGIEAHIFTGDAPSQTVSRAIAEATHVVVSIAPDINGDPVLRHHVDDLAQSTKLRWLSYLSTIGVYGNRDGAWIDETATVMPLSQRSMRRVAAENAWLEFARAKAIPLQIFRLAGIYGPGRSAIDKIIAGTARRLIKPGQVFNRIHVDDITETLIAGLERPQHTGFFNVTDDLPAPPQDVVEFAAQILHYPVPPDIEFETADLSPMARSFYSENKRVKNSKIRDLLQVKLLYPTYKEGLTAVAENHANNCA